MQNVDLNKNIFFLIPGIDYFDIDETVSKALLLKMFPMSYLKVKFNYDRTLCSKLNSGYCNLNVIQFDRYKIYSLSKMLLELFFFVYVDQNENVSFSSLSTCNFDDQKVTDCMCILVFLVDQYLQGKMLNIFFKEKFFFKYCNLFSCFEKYLLLKILIKISTKHEGEQLDILIKSLCETEEWIDHQEEMSAVDYYLNEIKNMNSLKRTEYGFFQSKEDFLSKRNLFLNLFSNILKCEKNFCDCLSELKDLNLDLNNILFIPIQHCKQYPFIGSRRFCKYRGKFLVENFKKLRQCRTFNNNTLLNKKLIVFAYSSLTKCDFYYCIYSDMNFACNDEDFKGFLRNFLSFDCLNQKTFFKCIPLNESCNLQEFMVIFEMIIFSRLNKMSLLKSIQSHQNYLAEQHISLSTFKKEQWPFNLNIQTCFLYFYVIVFILFSNSKRMKKIKIFDIDCFSKKKLILKYASSNFFKNKNIQNFYFLENACEKKFINLKFQYK